MLILHWSLVHSSPELSHRIRGSPNELTLSCRDDFGIAFPDAEFWLNSSTRLTDLLSTGSYVCPHTHTSSFYNSFVPRTIRNWNMFTAHVPLPTSVSSFKSNLWAYMRN